MKKKLPKIVLILIGIVLVIPTTCIIFLLSPILPGNEGVWNPVWSPDGQAIAFRCLFISPENAWDYQWEEYDFQYGQSLIVGIDNKLWIIKTNRRIPFPDSLIPSYHV